MVQGVILPKHTTQECLTFAGATTFPAFAAPLIGREQELTALSALLQQDNVRLLTLLGAGGIGKTRLATQVATALGHIFEDGLYFVSLVTLSAYGKLMDVLAQTLQIPTETQRPAFDLVKAYIGSRHILLLLDNFEQLVSGAWLIEQLLAACPRLSVLVTSRVSLQASQEQLFFVPPLAVPSLQEPVDLLTLAENPSVALFVQQARTRLPSFQLTESNAVSTATLCVRLDGLPLALELAAARITLLSPGAFLSRLSRRLPLLNKGDRTRPLHQQTLQRTIQWSYDLLSVRQQCLFRRLSIFANHFSLAAVEQVYHSLDSSTSNESSTVIDDIDALIDNSLLQPPIPDETTGEPRFSLLETLREFALEALADSGEMAVVRQVHALYYLDVVERASPLLHGPGQRDMLEHIEREYPNVQAAMNWLLDPEEELSFHKKALALRLGYALHTFWVMRGHLQEGYHFMEQALAMVEAVSMPIVAQALLITAALLIRLGDLSQAACLTEQSLAAFRTLNDQKHCAHLLRQAGWIAQQQGDRVRASVFYQESLLLFTDLDDQPGIANILLNMAFLAEVQGDYEQACQLFTDILRRQRMLKNTQGMSGVLYQLVQVRFDMSEKPDLSELYALLDEGTALAKSLGDTRVYASLQGLRGKLALYEGKTVLARTLVQECLDFHSQGGDRLVQGHYLTLLGRVAIAEHEYANAQTCFEECLTIGRTLNDEAEVISYCLEGMAALAVAQRQHPWAVQLWATAAHLRDNVGYPLPPVERASYEEELAQVRLFLGEQRFTSLWQMAYAFTIDEVLAARWKSVITVNQGPGVPPRKASAYPAGLTKREVQVLRLVAQGLTDVQVAEQLVISARTVTTHLTSIYNKLSVNSRAAATCFAAEHALL